METKNNSTRSRPRELAIKEGSLIPIGDYRRKETQDGAYSVAMTSEVWARCVAGPYGGFLRLFGRTDVLESRFRQIHGSIYQIVLFGWINRENPKFGFEAPDANRPHPALIRNHGVWVKLVLETDDDGKDCLTLTMGSPGDVGEAWACFYEMDEDDTLEEEE
jgi:hypothetical protein